jgi:hypothetical protein
MSSLHAVVCATSVGIAALTVCDLIRDENERLTRHPEDLTEPELTNTEIAIAAAINGAAAYIAGRVMMMFIED